MSRKALGRGLSSLIREVETAPAAGLEQVSVEAIDPNPFQPRRAFPEETLRELSDSVRTSGVVQPVLLRRAGAEGRFQLIAGERRWRAARLAGLEAVPAVIREMGDRETLELALTENLLREDLNPLEVARSYLLLQQNFRLSHEEIAEHLGVNRTTVTNALRLLRLPQSVQAMLEDGEISAGHARALAGLEDEKTVTRIARQIVDKGLSVRQTEELISTPAIQPAKRVPKAAPRIDPNIRAAVLDLERTLGTRVRIVGNGMHGRIEIKYFSGEDLSRLFDWIMRR
jgi:ParB family chromosome partitioning protein